VPDEILPFDVELAIPPRPEFVGVARLSVARVASLMPFSFDDVEDIRLAVGEACTRAIDRVRGAGAAPGAGIRLPCRGYPDRLEIEVRSPLVPAPPPAASEEDLGSMLIQILMDELSEEERRDEGLHVIRMVKYIGEQSRDEDDGA
jgi:anti-sigma regulatory factor (Ser/Thr protein kinase)